MFTEDDNLGFHYSHILHSNIVFLKFNNQNYMKYKSKNVSIKFLSGFFLSPEKIQSQEVRNSRNVYRIFPDLEFVEYKTNPLQSFGKNCQNKGKDLRFSSNFQSGNLFIAMKKKQFQYDLVIQNDLNSKGNTQWFSFSVEFSQ